MQSHQRTILTILLILFFLIGGFLFVQTVFAQEFGINEVGNVIALPTEDPRIVAARIIRVALGFLGIIALAIVLYGGFVWMTAAGNEERLAKAKKILTSALIGLIIIIFAFSITQFVLNRLMEAAGVGVEGPPGPPGPAGPPGLPAGAFVVRSIQPSGSVPIRNVVVRVIFNQNVEAASLTGNFTVKKSADASLVDGTVSTSGTVVEFTPNASCPPPNEDRKCFDADTEFVVELTKDVRSVEGRSLMCGGLAGSCRGTFTTGNLVDVTGPNIEITDPDRGQSVSADALVLVQTHATDDAGIAYLEYFADGSGESWDPDNIDTPATLVREYFGSRDWDTTGLTLLSRHTLTSRAFDIDTNNTMSSGVEVIVRAAHCFNGTRDEDETGVDCGGADCGGCDGDFCTSDYDCRSGFCVGGVCRDLPVITGVVPNDGAVGNYVTIFGRGFGTTAGSVFFGDVRAAFPAGCATGTWQDNQIIVEVPSGATDGPVRVEVPSPPGTTREDYIDRTDDERGPLLPNFDVNDIRRPGLCPIPPPAEGEPGAEVTITGTQLGATQGTSVINFGGASSGTAKSWSNTSVTVYVPRVAPATLPVQAVVGGENSNPVNFRVLPSAILPHISSFEPTTGPVGTYVTIFGANFGDTPGIVRFVAPDGTEVLADTSFPSVCGSNWWKNDQVVVKVPTGAGVARPGPNWVLKLTTSTGDTDDTTDLSPARFTVSEGRAGPGICQLNPDNGPVATSVTIGGERFGTTGTVKFWQNITAVTDAWNDTEISTRVPTGAKTGPVNVTVGTAVSNSVNFTVADCRTKPDPKCPGTQKCCTTGRYTGVCRPECEVAPGRGFYFWHFSTGTIPVYPRVVEECTGLTSPPPQPSPSPTPWAGRGQTSVCVNAQISVRFTTLIDWGTITPENILVQKCNDGEGCVDVTTVSPKGGYPEAIDIGRQTQVNFLPVGRFEPDTWYQVTLQDDIRSIDGYHLDGNKDGTEGGDYIFKFHTRANNDPCEVGGVMVQPYEHTAEAEGDQIPYLVQPLALGDNCLMLSAFSYPWDWQIRDPEGRLPARAQVERNWCYRGSPPAWQNDPERPDCARVTANYETVPDDPVQVVARLVREAKEGFGNLTIDYADPKVIEKWPDCDAACTEAAVGVRFNTPMDEASVENSANVKLYIWRCGNGVVEIGEDCDDGNATSGDGCSSTCQNEGKPLCAGLTPGWTEPSTLQNCCGNGRREVGEDCDGVPFPSGCKAVSGASDNCINLGTRAPTCGNGRIEEGEDCDPPTSSPPLGSLGCSASCTNLGSRALTPVPGNLLSTPPADYLVVDIGRGRKRYELNFRAPTLIPNTWYRGIISGMVESASHVRLTELNYDDPTDDRIRTTTANPYDSYSWVFKTKNDTSLCAVDRVEVMPPRVRLTWIGQKQDYSSIPYGAPDECNPNGQRLRPMSYNWGWRSVDTGVATLPSPLYDNYPKCGNGVIEIGEDCDDGSIANLIATPAVPPTSGDGCSASCLNEGSTGTAVCGNGRIEVGEDCDDRNTRSGDGCNSRCQNEGSVAGGSTCGNFAKENGEDCDDGNTTSGDGCSNICLNEGTPVAGRNPDGRIDPYQTAKAEGVRPGETESTTEIRATAQTKTGSAELTVVCGYRLPDKPCPTVTPELGIGTDTCCYPKPKVENCNPSDSTVGCSSGATNVCRNALLSVTFDQEMDQASIAGNILIAGNYGTCPAGSNPIYNSTQIPGRRDGTWCLGSSVATINTTPQTIIEGTTKKTRVDITLTKLLEPNRRYVVIVKGDNTGTAGIVEGVKSIKGVALGQTNTTFQETAGSPIYQARTWFFRTGPDICILEKVEIEPSSYLFTSASSVPVPPGTTPPNQYTFVARALDYRDRSISPIPGVYAWRWYWVSSIADTVAENVVSLSKNKVCEKSLTKSCTVDNECIVGTENYGPCIFSAAQVATAQNKNGEEILSATARISSDEILTPPTVGQTKTGTALATVYLCENPWPPKVPASSSNPTGLFPFEDKRGSNDFGSPSPTAFYNFKMHYCRDRGEFGEQDDLPSFDENTQNVVRKDYTPSDPNKDELLREYLFTFPEAIQENWYCSISKTPCDSTNPATCPAGSGECRPTPDAIGIRIYENADHLTPTEWYAKQGLAFGSPQSITIDGYEAIRDGRTVYVAAANDTDGPSTLYTNIYLISYNEGANDDTINIYNQLLENLRFNINLINQGTCTYRVCSNDATKSCTEDNNCATEANPRATCNDLVNCSKDIDCPVASTGSSTGTNICQAPKDKLVRDIKRIIDLTKIKKSIDSYRLTKGYNPKLEAGTYIRALTASVWGSWAGVLGRELGTTLPTDPINQIVDCTGTGYDAATCWNVDEQVYQCPAGSHIYQYKFNPSDGKYKLQSDFEYTKSVTSSDALRNLWSRALPSEFEVFGTCNNSLMRNTGVCGDGVINVNGAEECESGMTKEDACRIGTCVKAGGGKFCSGALEQSCTTNDDCRGVGTCVQEIDLVLDASGGCPSCAVVAPPDGTCPTGKSITMSLKSGTLRNGRQAYECNAATCTWRKVGSCTALCGDGVVQAGEQCDQGPTGGRVRGGGTSLTNQYACTPSCTWTGGYCGDGTMRPEYGERCDDGASCTLTSVCSSSVGCPCPSTGTPICTVAYGLKSCGNGGYGKVCNGNRAKACNADSDCMTAERPCRSLCKLDCTGFGPFCGDAVVNGNEECDGDSVRAKGVCVPAGTTVSDTEMPSSDRVPCESHDDCSSGTCSGGERNGQACGRPANCPGGTCSGTMSCATCGTAAGYPQFRTKPCGPSCSWQNWTACAPTGVCGNTIPEGDEECDDGNDNNNDDCIIALGTASRRPYDRAAKNCVRARCGDGFVQTGVEACDSGDRPDGRAPIVGGGKNGDPCVARYGETCNYCSTTCSILTLTGPRCGDGIKNGPEVCDNRQGTGLLCKEISGKRHFVDTTGASLGLVPNGFECTTCPTTNPSTPNCPAQPASPASLVWNRAICAADCLSTCPPSYNIQTLTFGAERRTSVDLRSGDEQTITLPACRILGDLKADVDMTAFTPLPLYVVFVVDESISMQTMSPVDCTGDGSIDSNDKIVICAKKGFKEAIDVLSDYPADVYIALVSSATAAAYGGITIRTTIPESPSGPLRVPSADECAYQNPNRSPESRAACRQAFKLVRTNEVTLKNIVDSITAHGGGEVTGNALRTARQLLEIADAPLQSEKAIILLSDGRARFNSSPFECPESAGAGNEISDSRASVLQTMGNAEGDENKYLKFVAGELAKKEAAYQANEAKSNKIKIYAVRFGSDPDGAANMQIWSSESTLRAPSPTSAQKCAIRRDDYNIQSAPKYFYDSNDVRSALRDIIESLTTATITVSTVTLPEIGISTSGIRTGTQIQLNTYPAVQCKSPTASEIQRQYNFKINFKGTGTVRISNLKAYVCPGPPWPP